MKHVKRTDNERAREGVIHFLFCFCFSARARARTELACMFIRTQLTCYRPTGTSTFQTTGYMSGDRRQNELVDVDAAGYEISVCGNRQSREKED